MEQELGKVIQLKSKKLAEKNSTISLFYRQRLYLINMSRQNLKKIYMLYTSAIHAHFPMLYCFKDPRGTVKYHICWPSRNALRS